jgi:hypothetical protein
MPRDAASLVSDLRKFTADDFDYMKGATGPERLYALCEEVEALSEPASVFPEFFALIERLSDSELGTPGPLVHTMEKHSGRYENLLEESLKRKPTDLSVWMVNRILNGEPEDPAFWMDQLSAAAEHPSATPLVKDQALHFIEFQKKK